MKKSILLIIIVILNITIGGQIWAGNAVRLPASSNHRNANDEAIFFTSPLAAPLMCTSPAVAVYDYSDPDNNMNPQNAIGDSDENYASIGYGEYINLDLTGNSLPIGSSVTINWRRDPGDTYDNPYANIWESTQYSSPDLVEANIQISNTAFSGYTVAVSENTRYLIIENNSYFWLRVESVTITSPCECTDGTITLASETGTENQTICAGTAITPIVYSIGGGANDATVEGLPDGVTGSLSGSTFTINGTPTVFGTFPYTVTTLGAVSPCNNATATGTISVFGYSGGDGSEGNPFQIANLADLQFLSENNCHWDKHFIQTANIDASATSDWNEWTGFGPIGNRTNRFTGSYDGQGYYIKDLTIYRFDIYDGGLGMFGGTSNAKLERIGLIDISIESDRQYVGGLVGEASNTEIHKSYVTGQVTGDAFVGGLVGNLFFESTIDESYTSCNVTGYEYVGGLVGVNQINSSITNSYATGNVSGNFWVGGLVGYNNYLCNISKSYSTGLVSGTTNIGGLVGINDGGIVTNSFWDMETSLQPNSAGGTGKTTAEMKTQTTFTGWDFVNIWGLDASVNDGYPNLEGKSSVLTASVSIEANPSGSVCTGTYVTFTATPVNGGTPTYQWMKNGTAVEGETGSTFTTDALADNDEIALVMTSSLSNVTGSLAISNSIVADIISLPDVPLEITGPATVCAGGIGINYSVAAVTDATSYNWTLPEGAEITDGSGTNSITVTFGSTSGKVSVTATNSCGTSLPGTLEVTVITELTPSVTITSSDSDNKLCNGQIDPIFTAHPANTDGGTVSYQWFLNEITYSAWNKATWTGTDLETGDAVRCEIIVTKGTCSVKAVSDPIVNEVYSQSDPSVTIESDVSGTFCYGTMVTFTATPLNTGGGTIAYQWNLNDEPIGSNLNKYTSDELENGDKISCDITVTNAACFDEKTAPPSNEIKVSVYDRPEAGIINGTSELCAGNTVTFSITGNSIPGSWFSSNESVATVDQSGNVTAVYAGSATIGYYVHTDEPCKDYDVEIFDVTVHQFIARITGFTEIGINGTTYLSPSTGGTWTSSNPAVASVTDEGIVTGIAAGTATFTYTAASGCSATTGELTVKTEIDCITPVATAPAVGDGSREHPYEIATLENLYWIKTNSSAWDKYFIQTADIDASSTAEWCSGGWLPIGNSENNYFVIHYDGNNHIISGLYISSTSATASGLFGAVLNSEFKNLGITDVYIDAVNADRVGALLGWGIFNVVIDNCYSTGAVKGHNYCGGLAGYLDNYNSETTIRNSYSTCNVSGYDFVGGLVGYCHHDVSVLNSYHIDGIVEGNKVSGGLIGWAYRTMISKCYSTGNVTGNSGDGTGGLVGSMFNSGINNSYSRCTITNTSTTLSCGGLVGLSSSQIDYPSIITNCYSTGPVQSGMGGLVGRLDTYGNTTIINSFWDTETSGTTTSAGGTGKPTILMKMKSTFTDAEWDFENVWGIFHSCNDGYPYLRQENLRIPSVTITSDVSGEICNGIDPIFTATPTNTGVGNVSYSWKLNDKSVGLDQNSYTLINPVPGYSYKVSCEITVTDPASCTSATASSDEIIITVAPFPDAGVISVVDGGDNEIEVGEQITLNSTIPGGMWGCKETDIASVDLYTGVVTGKKAGTASIIYAIPLEAAPPCNYEFSMSEFPVTVISGECTNPTSGGEISGNQTICAGSDPVAFTSTSEASGHTGTLEYKWQNSDGNDPYDWEDLPASNSAGFDDSQTLNSSRWYRRLARVDCSADWTGAEESNVVVVTVKPQPTLTDFTIDKETVCEDYESEDARPTITFSGLLNADNRINATLIENGNTDEARIGDIEISQLDLFENEGSWYYKIKPDYAIGSFQIILNSISANGCTNTFEENEKPTISWTIYPRPTASISGDLVACEKTTLTAETDAVSATYKWYKFIGPIETTTLDETSSTLEVSESGSYGVLITDTETGCINADWVDVTVNPLPSAFISYAGSPYCATDMASVSFKGQTGGTFEASPAGLVINSTTGEINLEESSAGTYTVTYNFSDGTCSNSISETVTINSLPDVTFASKASNTPICEGDNATFFLTGTANAVVSYSIKDIYEETTGSITLSSTGEATVVENSAFKNQTMMLKSVQDPVTECTKVLSATEVVEVKQLPEASFDSPASNSPVCAGEIARFYITGTPGSRVTFRIEGDAANIIRDLDETGKLTVNVENVTSDVSVNLISVEYPDGLCTVGLDQSTTVVVNPLPTMSSITVDNAVSCSGTDVTVTIDGLVAGPNTINYDLSVDGGDPINYDVDITASEEGVYSFVSFVLPVGNYTLTVKSIKLWALAEGEEDTRCNINEFAENSVSWTVNTCCTNPTSGGEISGNQTICAGSDPVAFTSTSEASGYTGTLEYKWQYSDVNAPYNWQELSESNRAGFDDNQQLNSARWYRRLAKVACSADWTGAAESNVLEVTLETSPIAGMLEKEPALTKICEGTEVYAFLIPGSGGNFTDELEYRTKTDSSWSEWSAYGEEDPISTSGKTAVEIRTHRMADACNPSEYHTVGWLVEASPVAALLVKSSDAAKVCEGTVVWTYLSEGPNGEWSGGNNTDETQYRTKTAAGWSNWANYASGTSIPTDEITSVEIQTRRMADVCEPSAYNTVSWMVEARPVLAGIAKYPNVESVCEGSGVSARAYGGSGGTGTIMQYRTQTGSTWSDWETYSLNDYQFVTNGIIFTTGKSGVEIRALRLGTFICNSSDWIYVSWSVVAQPVAASIIKLPDAETICEGTEVSAEFTEGSGGVGCSDTYGYRYDGTGEWTEYTPGATLSTTGHSLVEIRTQRGGCQDWCDTDTKTASWEVNLLPAITTSAASISAQYSDPVVPVEITVTDNGALSSLTASVKWKLQTDIDWTDGLPDNLTLVDGTANDGIWMLSGNSNVAPGSYTIKVTINDVQCSSSVEIPLNVGHENADIDYIGTEIVGEANPDVNTTPVALRATITDIDDGNRGDIRNARVRFEINGSPISGWLVPTLVNPADFTQGIVSYVWNAPVPSSGYATYDITVNVGDNGYYKGSLDDVPVTVYRTSLKEFISGGGHIIPVDSKGEYASDPGRKVNFGFNVKWNKTMKNLQGNFNLILRRGSEIYQIKTNALSGLGIDGSNPCSHKAVLTAKANLNRVTGGITENILGNLSLQVTLTDNGDPGVTDMIGVTLYNGSTLLYSSSWPVSSTEKLTLVGGNIVVNDGLICNASDITYTVIASGKNPSLTGEEVIITATVYGHDVTPQGTLVFSINGETFAGTLDSKGSTTVDYSFDEAGTYEIKADYISTNGYKPSTGNITQLVNGSSFILSSSKNPSVSGDEVTFTAVLNSPDAAPAGTVTFKVDGEVKATNVPLVDKKAMFTTNLISSGSHTIEAVYTSTNNPSIVVAPATLTQVVNNVSISLASSKNPSVITEAVVFTATVTGSASIGETVTFFNDGSKIGIATVDLSGNATVSHAFGTAGTYVITAECSGKPVTLSQVVTNPVITLVSSLNPSAENEDVTFTATVTGASEGTIRFTNGAGEYSTILNDGKESWTIPLSEGSYLIIAEYYISGNLISETSLTQVVTAENITVELVSSKPLSVVYGTNITYTATVKGSVAAPSGTITFKDGSTVLKNVLVSGGKASFSTNKLAVGYHPITATYNLTGTVSDTIKQTVTAKTKSAEIATDLEPVVELAELKVYPNPFSERLRFEFVSPEPVNARIDLYDMTGRLVKTIFEQPVEGGIHYNAEFWPDAIVSAMYIYRVTLGEAVYNGKVVFKKE